MPDVELVATKDFSYATRRLKAGDSFTVTAPMARVLVGIGKAELPREPGQVGAPPARVLDRAMTATRTAEKPAPRSVGVVSTRSTTGKATTRKRRTTRKSAAKKG
jgi:hypothetical protein